jgi:hypothetical protein
VVNIWFRCRCSTRGISVNLVVTDVTAQNFYIQAKKAKWGRVLLN